MLPFINLDLFAVGLTGAAIGILGFVIFLGNYRSITNQSFFAFSLLTILYSIFNYSFSQIGHQAIAFWFLRFTIFFAVWHAYVFFQLFYVFPKDNLKFTNFYNYFLTPVTIATSILTLTPFVFNRIAEFSSDGHIVKVVNGPGIIIFGLVVIGLVLGGIFLLIKKTLIAKDLERIQLKFISFGGFFTFSLILFFNFILPVIFDNSRFVFLAPVWIFPFIAFSFYAILKHHLLNIKVVATEMLTFVLAVISLFEVVLSKEPAILLFRASIFALVLVFGILLIRSVLKEIQQREKLQELTVQLEAANKQLVDLSRFKTELLSLASHQVKSPLAVIKGYASILLDGLYGKVDGKVKETVFKMKESTEGLIVLVNNLLDLRKIEEGRMEYKFEPLKFSDLITNAVLELKPLAESKNLELSFEAHSDKSVNADAVKLKQVIQNLVDNAIKYTPKGFVKVELKEDGEWLSLSVQDSGLGMSKELLPQVFQEFIRDERVKKEIRGTGLGLYIAKKIVEAHNGEIWAESEGEGEGSCFYVKLKVI